MKRVRRFPWVSIALFGGTLAIYVLTLTPGVLGGDVGELQFVPYILSMAHPTGTPLYCLLGWLWTRLPLGPSVAWQMNLLSAVFASLAIVVVYQTVTWLVRRRVPALIAALSLAWGPVFWEQATMADKYAFNALLVALVLYFALRWGESRTPATLNLLAFTYGVSLTHHRTMLLFAPVLLGYVWWQEKGALWRDRRRLLRLLVLFALPLLVYLYLPWAEARNLPPGTWHPRTLSDWYHYLADTGQIGYLYIDPADLGDRLLFFAQTLQRDFTWIGVVLGLGGLVMQLRRRPVGALFLLSSFVLHGFLAANHHLPRQWTFFIPSFLIFALWIGEGLGAVWAGLEDSRPGRSKAGVALLAALAILMLAWPLMPFGARYRSFREAHLGAGVLDVWRQALKQGRMGDRVGRAIAGVAAEAVIVGDWEQATPLWYFQQVEGLRPDVQIVYPVDRLAEAAASGRPLYLTRNDPAAASQWHPSSSGPLIALHAEPVLAPPADVVPINLQMGDDFRLAGVTYGEAALYPAMVAPLTLHWQALQSPSHDYSVSLRLFDEAGEEIAQVDSQHPVLGTYPTSLWTAGEFVSDYYELQLPGDLPPGPYRWGVILYRSLPDGGWENLKVAGTGGEMAEGGTLLVSER
ncbi:MAG: DUF2723 domain-containing protein [Anaerolineae bacterium]|jgi:hypothetical protein